MKRRLIAILCAFAALTTLGFAPEQQETRELKGKSNGHAFRVILKVRNFKADGRKITFKPDPHKELAGENILINGAEVYGFDGIYKEMAPNGATARTVLENRATEIYRFDVWLDGKRIRIPRKRYEIALQARLDTADAEFSKDGKTFFVFVSGSDGAGSWSARWVIERKTGKVRTDIARGG